MAKTRRGKFDLDLEPLVRLLGLDYIMEQLGAVRLAEQLKKKKYLSQLSPELCRELSELLRKRVESATKLASQAARRAH